MEQQNNKLIYLVIGLVILLLIFILSYLIFGRNKIISPVPEEGIKVIFTTPLPSLTPSPTATATAAPKATVKATPTPKVSPTASSSALPER